MDSQVAREVFLVKLLCMIMVYRLVSRVVIHQQGHSIGVLNRHLLP